MKLVCIDLAKPTLQFEVPCSVSGGRHAVVGSRLRDRTPDRQNGRKKKKRTGETRRRNDGERPADGDGRPDLTDGSAAGPVERDDGAAAGHASQAHGNTDRLASSINQGPLVFCCLQQVRTRIPHAPRRPKPNLAPDWSFSDSDRSGTVLVFLLILFFDLLATGLTRHAASHDQPFGFRKKRFF